MIIWGHTKTWARGAANPQTGVEGPTYLKWQSVLVPPTGYRKEGCQRDSMGKVGCYPTTNENQRINRINYNTWIRPT